MVVYKRNILKYKYNYKSIVSSDSRVYKVRLTVKLLSDNLVSFINYYSVELTNNLIN